MIILTILKDYLEIKLQIYFILDLRAKVNFKFYEKPYNVKIIILAEFYKLKIKLLIKNNDKMISF